MKQRTMRKTRLFALIVLMSGCQFDPNASFYTTIEPVAADLAGQYILQSQTVLPGGLAVLQDKKCRIELHEDQTFTATNVPPAQSDSPDDAFFDRLVSVSGTWKIDTIGSIANGSQPPKKHWGVSFESEDASVMSAGLTQSSPPYGLIFTLGDPDAGRVMYFEREK